MIIDLKKSAIGVWRVNPASSKKSIFSFLKRKEPTAFQKCLALHIYATSNPKSALH